MKQLLTYVMLLIALPAFAQTTPPDSAVVSAHPIATQAGVDILEQGGNAFDAAIAISSTLGVVEPFGSGIGGGGFWLIYDAEKDTYSVIDARETAPIKAHKDMYLDEQGEVIPNASTQGPLAAGIPGLPYAYVDINQRLGTLSLDQTMKPAITAAREGFAVDDRYINGVTVKRDLLLKYPESANIFLDQGNVPQEGWTLKQFDLAHTLENIEQFYENDAMIADVKKHGGIWSKDDFLSYETIWRRDPVIAEYKGAKIVMPPLPSSGGLVITNTLNILKGYENPNKHIIIEAMKQAYRERALHMGDTDFLSNAANKPIERILFGENVQKQRELISHDKALPSEEIPLETSKGTETTHFAVIDEQGNRVAVTQSINFWFGSGFVPKGTGVLLNNEMDDFTIKPGVENGYGLHGTSANAIEPHKRMLSSMTPTFVETNKGLLILGTPGGSRIISMNLLAMLDFINGEDPAEIIQKPRYHHQYLPDVVVHEEGAFTPEEITDLKAKGHTLKQSSRRYGNMQMIHWDYKTGMIKTYSDPRGSGAGRVY